MSAYRKVPLYEQYYSLSKRELCRKMVKLNSANERLKKDNQQLREEIQFLHMTLQMDQLEKAEETGDFDLSFLEDEMEEWEAIEEDLRRRSEGK